MNRTLLAVVVLACLALTVATAMAGKQKPEPKGTVVVVYQGDGCRIEVKFPCDWAMVSVTGDPIVVWGLGPRPTDFAAALKVKSGVRRGWASATFVVN